jgi:hypothetical protein
VAVGFWGLDRFIEEHLWLAYPGHVGAIAVQVAGLVLCFAGFGVAVVLLARRLPKSPSRASSLGAAGPERNAGMGAAAQGQAQSVDA